MTKQEVKRLYEIWKFHRSNLSCYCASHEKKNKDVCMRELSWRHYCQARDEYLGERSNDNKKVDLRDIFDLFDFM